MNTAAVLRVMTRAKQLRETSQSVFSLEQARENAGLLDPGCVSSRRLDGGTVKKVTLKGGEPLFLACDWLAGWS